VKHRTVARYEGILKVTGQARYEGEVMPEGMLHAALVESPVACGELLSLDASRAETLPGFASSAWFGVVGPPKLPGELAAKISADIAEALRQPDVRKRFADLSAEPVGGTPGETAAFMRTEVDRWNNVIRAANVRLEQ